jgi:hypothetical protein
MKYVNPLQKMVVLMQFFDVLMTVVNKATTLLLELAVLCYPRYDWIIILRDLKLSFFIASKLSKLAQKVWWNVSGFNCASFVVLPHKFMLAPYTSSA